MTLNFQTIKTLLNRSANVLAICFLGGWSVAAENKNIENPVEAKVTFEEHIQPIFRQHCASCHHQGDKKGGLALDTFTAVFEGGASGEVVFDDGDYENSRLWQLVNHDDTPKMPPNKEKLPADQLEQIRKWIAGGSLENNGSKAKAKKKNSLAFVAASSGRPEGGGAMPDLLPQHTPVVTQRAAATSAIAASPWAPLVAIAGQKQIVIYHGDTHQMLGILPFPEGIAQSLRFSRDGSFLIAGGGEHSVLGIVAVYDVKTGKRVAQVGEELDTVFDSDANDAMNRIALGGPMKMLRIYDATDGTKLFDLKKHTDWILSVAYSPDGVLLASGDRSGGLCVWEAETGRQYLDLTGHKGAIHAVAWRDDSNVLASASADGTVKIWEMSQGKVIKNINVNGGAVHDVGFDHQARLITSSADNKAKLWDANGNHIRDFQPMAEDVLEVEISHDGKTVIFGDWTGQVLSVATDDPSSKQNLVANPPSAKIRLDDVQKKLMATRSELKPLVDQLASATATLTKVRQAKAELQKQIVAKQQAAIKVQELIQQAQQQLAKLDQQLTTMTTTSRDLQDALIVARVHAKADPEKAKLPANLESLATTEQTLANHLYALAAKRRERVQTQQQLDNHQAASAARTAEAGELATQMPPLEQRITTAIQTLHQIQANHAKVQARMLSVQRLRDAIQAEMN